MSMALDAPCDAILVQPSRSENRRALATSSPRAGTIEREAFSRRAFAAGTRAAQGHGDVTGLVLRGRKRGRKFRVAFDGRGLRCCRAQWQGRPRGRGQDARWVRESWVDGHRVRKYSLGRGVCLAGCIALTPATVLRRAHRRRAEPNRGPGPGGSGLCSIPS
ncbi:hypothetical protein L226DRAFT_326843 [Lentinus tigrinus ALCF2SS1-7]|uniref:Uncharacterized protein n=1 Tax=Lentinus tigrinus ALCF2SS1-6 TaxID=1328759 RepID=A0A5C2SFX5_9APHY|nr:hypothetical protein L227DRAFT_432023 [Lentinus tigrinus ALCF2SS1-6]RPD77600.1 hypothetical protein L226DRAFT_326843 [Lentinus tigrinus ALCF2SS1-7]